MEKEKNQQYFEMSPYDPSFPMQLLQDAFDCRMQEAQLTTERIYADVLSTHAASIPEIGTEKLRLVVDSSDDLLKDYADGTIKLAREKGHLVAQIKENGRYGSKLPIKEETYIDGANALDVQNSLQLRAIQEALVKVSAQIQAIDSSVKEVLIGQQNDRLALYYSGVALFVEAQSITNESLKQQLLAQSIKALSDAIFKLTLSVQTDILYLARHEYDNDKKKSLTLLIAG